MQRKSEMKVLNWSDKT